MIGLDAVAVVPGSSLLRIEELPEWALLEDAEREIASALGIETVADTDGACPVVLVAEAASRALSAAGVDADDVDALVVIPSRAPDLLVASEATRVQQAVGAHRAVTFGVGELGCASIGPALLTARALLLAEPAWEHVLVLHASIPPPGGRYRHPVTISGAAAGAVVVGRAGGMVLLDVQVASDGRYWDLFSIDYRGGPPSSWVERCRDVKEYSFRLAIESRSRLRSQSALALKQAGLAREDVAAFLMQNLSMSAYRFYEEAFGLPVATSCGENLRRFGHLGPLDVLLNLQTATEAAEVGTGDPVLLFSNSPAAAWTTIAVRV